ncbi:MAG: hypothetical protein RBS43_10235 [Candidatus Cloacimonas sp.]|nr:hypothetical protein [Candidatus Cloacimonas sp.]
MKKLYLLLLLLVCTLGLFAQSGLFNLSYAILATEADSILALSNFENTATGVNTITYTPTDNDLVSAIILFIEPKTERMIGWFIKYNPDNTEENDDYVLKTLQQMHGEKNHMDEETQQLVWFLSTTRTVHVMYAEDNSLTVLYYDSHFQELFKAKDDVPEVKLQPLEPGIYGYPGVEEPEVNN